jgi:hypothetical protein
MLKNLKAPLGPGYAKGAPGLALRPGILLVKANRVRPLPSPAFTRTESHRPDLLFQRNLHYEICKGAAGVEHQLMRNTWRYVGYVSFL